MQIQGRRNQAVKDKIISLLQFWLFHTEPSLFLYPPFSPVITTTAFLQPPSPSHLLQHFLHPFLSHQLTPNQHQHPTKTINQRPKTRNREERGGRRCHRAT